MIVQIANHIEAHFLQQYFKFDVMSSAFVKEGEYQKLSDVAPSISALSFYLRQENGGLVIRPMKKWLDLKFYSKVPHKEKPVIKSVLAGKKYENHIRLSSLDELMPGTFIYLRESYELI